MGVNKYVPHVLVIPEDDANRQLANGFLLDSALHPCMQVAPPCGGWSKVMDHFDAQQLSQLRRFPHRHLVLLMDFDGRYGERHRHCRERIPDDVRGRVYVLGTSDEPEPLRATLGLSLERIGEALAASCGSDTAGWWEHDMLKHNQGELERLAENVKPFLFRNVAGGATA